MCYRSQCGGLTSSSSSIHPSILAPFIVDALHAFLPVPSPSRCCVKQMCRVSRHVRALRSELLLGVSLARFLSHKRTNEPPTTKEKQTTWSCDRCHQQGTKQFPACPLFHRTVTMQQATRFPSPGGEEED
mmetsp:Transcript_19733/g.55774  ORF Transcript_19733/g.55774 Transcript_19733/m.55774 type:complete len:130 (+) Transcript_19733:90-479(+)